MGRRATPPITLNPVKILVGAGACALLIGSAACVTAAPASACPYGTQASAFSGVCVSGGTDGDKAIPNAPDVGASYGGGPNELPSVNGVPCTPWQLGSCIGMAESEG